MPPKRKSRMTSRKSTPTTMAVVMLTLPVELQSQVVSYLTSRKDLKAVCLVCKELQSIATPTLYHSVTLALCHLKDNLKKRLHQGNPGIVHIRKLTTVTLQGAYRHSRYGRSLTDLLLSMPKDGLTTFSLDTDGIIPLDISYILRLSQRKLTNFVLHHVAVAPMTDYLPDAGELRNVTSVSFYIGSEHDAKRAAKVLEQGPAIHSLSLQLTPGFHGTILDNACQHSVETIFSAWSTSPEGQKLSLKRVFFDGFYFTTCGPLLATVLAPAHLSEVIMFRCWDTNLVLEGLSQAGLQLRRLTDDSSIHDSDDEGTVEALLQSFRGLETLRLTTGTVAAVNADCNWSSIRHHAATLTSLFIDDFAAETMPFVATRHDRTMAEFKTAMRDCSALKQLAIRAPSRDRHPRHFNDFLDCLRPLSNLCTLRLFVYLDVLDGSGDIAYEYDSPEGVDLQRSEARTYVAKLANDVFGSLHESCPRLVALVIDGREIGVERCYGDECQQSGFLRVMQKDVYGRTTAAAVTCKPSDLKLHEPCSDILNDDIRFSDMV